MDKKICVQKKYGVGIAICAGILLVALLQRQIGTNKTNINSRASEKAIINGTVVPKGKYPFIALIKGNENFFLGFQCTGVLIDKQYVLTAKHCTQTDNGADPQLSLAVNIVNKADFDSNKIRVEKIITPPAAKYCHTGRYDLSECTTDTYSPDLALLKLEKEVTNVNPLPLYLNDLSLGSPQTVIAIGFGLTSNNTAGIAYYLGLTTSSVLRERNATINTKISSVSYIVDTSAGESAVAPGDSGGPLIYKKNENIYLAGINVSTPESITPEYSNSIRVYMYKSWIDSVIHPSPPLMRPK